MEIDWPETISSEGIAMRRGVGSEDMADVGEPAPGALSRRDRLRPTARETPRRGGVVSVEEKRVARGRRKRGPDLRRTSC